MGLPIEIFINCDSEVLDCVVLSDWIPFELHCDMLVGLATFPAERHQLRFGHVHPQPIRFDPQGYVHKVGGDSSLNKVGIFV